MTAIVSGYGKLGNLVIDAVANQPKPQADSVIQFFLDPNTGLLYLTENGEPWNQVAGGGSSTAISRSTGSVTVGSGGQITAVTANGNAGGAGAGRDFTVTTGNEVGGASARGGNIVFTLGTGDPGTGAPSHNGQFLVVTPLTTSSNPAFSVNDYGIGIGTIVTGGLGSYSTRVYNTWTVTDATEDMNALQSLMIYPITSNNSHQFWSAVFTVRTGTSANSYTGALNGIESDTVAYATGGTIALMKAGAFFPITDTTCTAAITAMVGAQHHPQHFGTGTVTTMRGADAHLYLSPSGGGTDGNITNAFAFEAQLRNESTAGTPGVISNGYNFYATAPNLPSVGTIQSIYGLYVESMINTTGGSSTAGSLAAYGAYINLPNQGGNTSGTDTNIGLFITGNGGTAGGGGSVSNFAIRSDSTANTRLSGPQLQFAQGSNYTILVNTSTTANAAGGNLTVGSGVGNGSGTGGAIIVGGGNGGGTGAGGQATVAGGNAGGGTANGGNVTFTGGAPASTGTPGIARTLQTHILAGAVTDGFCAGIRLQPTYDQAFTVTRLNYLDLNDVTLTNSAVVTNAAVMRFNANAGTHKAVDSGTTKTTPGGVDAWVKININGTLYFMPAYVSKTA